jgi:two-component system, chemotaxis family, protein-glutamate methylesterase/glutaminase
MPRPGFDIVAIAASAGGFVAVRQVVAGLPRDLPASVVVVQHLDPRHQSVMAELLQRHTAMRIGQARAGDLLEPGLILIGPPDHHLLVNEDGTIVLTQTKLVNFVRPSADLLFESVAGAYQDRAICAVLTGSGVDGSQGAEAVKKMGGTVIAQDEATSEFFSMPRAAIKRGCVDFVLALDEIAPVITKLVTQGAA